MMKVTMAKSELVRAATMAGKALSRQSTLPVLGCICIDAGEDSATFTATDLDTSIRCHIGALVDKPGSVAIAGKLLIDIAKNLGDGAVTIESHGRAVSLTCCDARFDVNGMLAEDFPGFPKVDPDATIEIPTSRFQEVVKPLSRFTAKDETRPVLRGISILADGESLRFAATDSYRIGRYTLDIACGSSFNAVIGPAAIADALSATDNDGTMKISYSENQVVIACGDTTIISRRVFGNFPNIDRFFSEEGSTRFDINRKALLDTLKRVSVLQGDTTTIRVKLDPQQGTVGFSSAVNEVGSAAESLPADIQGKGMEIGVNSRYLIDTVEAASTDTIRFSCDDPKKPIYISAGSVSFNGIVMPVRI